MKLDDLIELGREFKTISSKRGGLLQLDEAAYLTNDRHSIAFIIEGEFGSGSFFAEECPKGTTEISDRGEKTVFEVKKGKGGQRHIFVPSKKKIKDEVEKVFKKYYKKPTIAIPNSIFDVLDEKILMISLKFKNNTLSISQKRSDGSVQIESTVNLNFGFLEQEVEDSDEITLYTADFLILRNINKPKFALITKESPLCISGLISGAKAKCLISFSKYEV